MAHVENVSYQRALLEKLSKETVQKSRLLKGKSKGCFPKGQGEAKGNENQMLQRETVSKGKGCETQKKNTPKSETSDTLKCPNEQLCGTQKKQKWQIMYTDKT